MQTIEQSQNNNGMPEIAQVERHAPNGEQLVANANEIVDYALIEQRAREALAKHISPEKKITIDEYENNARTAIFEALTSSGHASRIEFAGDVHTVHQQIMTRLLNGYDRSLPQHELNRRFAELCEELAAYEIFCAVERGEIPLDIQISTISDFATPLGAMANKLGYRELNRKGMVRTTWLERDENGNLRRVLEQISRSNSDAHETIMMLHQEGVTVERRGEADVDVLGTQLIDFRREAMQGALGLMRRLDAFAGPNIMYGEPKSAETVVYENLHEISHQRENRVEGFVKQLAQFEATIDRSMQLGEISWQKWQSLYMREVTDIVRSICVLNPDYVKNSLGSQVQEAYDKAHEQYLSGDTAGADATVASAADQENEVVICGNDSSEEQQPPISELAGGAVKRLLDQSKKWEYIKGRCRITNCPTSGKQTDVGPCDVCRLCQSYYDQKRDPVKEYTRQLRKSALEAVLSASKPAEQILRRPKLVKVESGISVGSAEAVYRDQNTGSVGTKEDFGLAS